MSDRVLARQTDPESGGYEDEFFFMANLEPDDTGLPMFVWISEKGRARHAARIKVCPNHAKMCPPEELVAVSINDPVEVKAGTGLSNRDLKLVERWILANRELLLAYWNSEISTRKALSDIQKTG